MSINEKLIERFRKVIAEIDKEDPEIGSQLFEIYKKLNPQYKKLNSQTRNTIDELNKLTTKGITADPKDPDLDKIRDNGQQEVYLVLSAEERAKGFVRPVRRTYEHISCGTTTTMGQSIAETYARDPKFYGATFCCKCGAHFPLWKQVGDSVQSQFRWDDGSPVGY